MEIKKPMVCFDTETGGLSQYTNGLCSYTFKEVGEDNILTVFLKPVKGLKYSSSALKVNGLTLEELEKIGVSEEEALKKLKDWVDEIEKREGVRPGLLAHNINFDLKFMRALYSRNFDDLIFDDDFNNVHECTMRMFASMIKLGIYPKISKKLSNVYFHLFTENFEDAHTSEADVIATERVYKRMVEDMNKYEEQQKENDKNYLE